MDMDDKNVDTAAEPVDDNQDELTDTGVLHERPKKAADPGKGGDA
jgi:hypothetical protein